MDRDNAAPMTAPQLRAIGHDIFGRVWQAALAHALGVSVRSLQRWSTGERPIAHDVADRIRALHKVTRQSADAASRHRIGRDAADSGQS